MTAPQLVRRGAPGWPASLEHLGAATPATLWVRSRTGLEECCRGPALAIVGARRPTAAGERFTHALAAGVAREGVVVISGLALGIDAAAHAGALAGGGRTVAVLGCGIDQIYPRRNDALGLRVVALGAVVSEWGPGVPPAPWRFPARNRIVAALAQAVLVVEASGRSGALITADHGLGLGRDVLAVPGWPWTALAEGANKLLRAGAQPVRNVEDALDALGLSPRVASAQALRVAGRARAVWDELRRHPRRRDALALELGLDAEALALALTELELEGLLGEETDGTLVAVAPS